MTQRRDDITRLIDDTASVLFFYVMAQDKDTTPKAPSRMERLIHLAKAMWEYYNTGVWKDTRKTFMVNLVKTVNLTMRGFMDGGLQNKACMMTYRTVLALVPMLALLLAIGRGFGLQDYLQTQLYGMFPGQERMLSMSFKWVDSYLAQASEGLFVGIGILFLLWTLISLLSSVEDVFNMIWNVKNKRSQWRKISDYIAILLILPILLICSSGIRIFMSSALQRIFDFEFMTPLISLSLDAVAVVLCWLFFAGCYAWIPNAKVKFTNALIAGALAGTGFQVLQWIFVSGQMYVAKYNAIYGSFSFLPLMLIWLQLVWLITFIGAGVCYSLQNIMTYSYDDQCSHISVSYRTKVEMAILAVIVQRFKKQLSPLTEQELCDRYELPPRLVSSLIVRLIDENLICHVIIPGTNPEDVDDMPLQPLREPEFYSVGRLVTILDNHGDSDFIPGFSERFGEVITAVDNIEHMIARGEPDVSITSLVIPVED